jgi:glycosyltransferase involved in cell wall biosynthesis
MAPVEMMACGKPVVALAAGGALETVVDGVTGVFANAQTVEAFVRAISALEQRRFDPERIRAHAERFSRESFARAFRRLVDEAPPLPAVRSLNGAPSAMPT